MLSQIYQAIVGIWEWLATSENTYVQSFNDMILDSGDWIVSWLWSIVAGIVNFIVGYFLWRFLTVIVVAAFSGAASRILGTGIALYLIAWFWAVSFRVLGIGFVTFNVWAMGLVPNIEMLFLMSLDLVPAAFQPMLAYMGVPDAFHFIFSAYLAAFTIKLGKWVFSAPSFFS